MRRSLVSFSVAAPLLVSVIYSSPASADLFGSGVNSFDVEFVTIGDPGNPADMTGAPRPAGSVPYVYRIGKYEISERMIEAANAVGGLGITKDTRGPDKPATSITWFEAATFVNWLNTSTGHMPAYKFVEGPGRPPARVFALWEPGDLGYDPNNLFRNRLAHYFLPSSDEWYKAAYYDPVKGVYWDYPTGSNLPPIPVASGTAPGTAVFHQGLITGPAEIMQAGGISPFGTMAQSGNVGEWEETQLDLVNADPMGLRGGRGGNWETLTGGLTSLIRSGGFPSIPHFAVGFRVASIVPEPGSAALFGVGLFGFFGLSNRYHARSQRSRHDAQHNT